MARQVYFVDQLAELIKKVGGVMGAGGSLRMVLDTEYGVVSVAHPFHRAVVQVDVRNLYLRGQ